MVAIELMPEALGGAPALVLSVAAVEEMITEAHETAEDTRLSVLAFSAGFALLRWSPAL